LKRVLKFPNVEKVYGRAGRGQGTGQGIVAYTNSGVLLSGQKGFLRTVQIWLQGETLSNAVSPPALPTWIRKCPLGSNDLMNVQIDVTNIPSVRPLRKDGTFALSAE
jgi:hypothetical protein